MVRPMLVALVGSLRRGGASSRPPPCGHRECRGNALDGVDGWLARRRGMSSAFGARFDMEIDALLVQVLAILVWRYGKAAP